MFESLDGLLKRDTIETSHGTLEINELSAAAYVEMRNAGVTGNEALTAATAVKWGVPSLSEYSAEEIANSFPMAYLQEIFEAVMLLSDFQNEDGEEVDVVGNSEAGQNAA